MTKFGFWVHNMCPLLFHLLPQPLPLLSSFSVRFTPSSKKPPTNPHRIPPCQQPFRLFTNAPPTGYTCHGVTPGPVCLSHTVYEPSPSAFPACFTYHNLKRPPTQFLSRVFRVSLFRSPRPDFRLHSQSPAPRPHRPPAFGRRVS